ncbi:MAG: GNAT family N-acetyltransferase [Acidimicrobiales bacterium]
MTDVEVRPIRDDELADYVRCVATAFFFEANLDDDAIAFWRERMENDLSRRHGAFVDGVLAGTIGAFATELTVPGGGAVDLAAVTAVTVLPTHRRRGLLRRMMETQQADALERGEVAAMLIAAEWPIYERYGYGMAAEAASTVLDASAALFRDGIGSPSGGTIALVAIDELRVLAPRVFDAHRLSVAGAITRSDFTWDLLLGLRNRPGDDAPKGTVAVVHRDAEGTVDGYAVYRAREQWIENRPSVTLDVDELLSTSDAAYRDLWAYLASIDWVREVRAGVRPVDEQLRFLLHDGRAAVQRERSDHMWVRIFDVERALAARRYEAPVDIVVEVRDPQLGSNRRWRLEGGPDGASATRSTRDVDIALSVDALGGAYLGGTPLWWFASAGKVDERTPGALARLGTAMRTAHAPWATTNF